MPTFPNPSFSTKTNWKSSQKRPHRVFGDQLCVLVADRPWVWVAGYGWFQQQQLFLKECIRSILRVEFDFSHLQWALDVCWQNAVLTGRPLPEFSAQRREAQGCLESTARSIFCACDCNHWLTLPWRPLYRPCSTTLSFSCSPCQTWWRHGGHLESAAR